MLKSRTILLVDDNAAELDLLFKILNQLGHRVLIAENEEAAMIRCKLSKPDLVFMDSILPGIDGFGCCRRIQEEVADSNTPIIMMLDEDDSDVRQRSYKSGACAVITKPVMSDEVLTILKHQLELLDLRKELNAVERSGNNFLDEFDIIVDLIAHDMKTPIFCISGFSEELLDQFSEMEVSEQWHEFLGFIHKSSTHIDIILEALVLLKNLRVRDSQAPESISLKKTLDGAASRYEQLEYYRPLELQLCTNDCFVLAQAATLEELILTLFRIFSDLAADQETLKLSIEVERTNARSQLLRINTNTRAIETEELTYILEPLQGRKRTRVKDTNILALCVQKMIAYLAINAWAEHGSNNTLTICLMVESEES